MNRAEFPDWFKPTIPPRPKQGASDALPQALRSTVANPPTTPASIPEKSLIQQPQDTVTLGRKSFENNKKPTRDVIVQRIRRIRSLLVSLFGRDTPIVKNVGFEQEAQSCSFAFASFTPDDEVANPGQIYNQARSNVFCETGLFNGRLGWSRVILLLKFGAKIHSYLEGVYRIEFANKVGEKFIEIQDELNAAK